MHLNFKKKFIKEKIYKANSIHPYFKEGIKIKIRNDNLILNNECVPINSRFLEKLFQVRKWNDDGVSLNGIFVNQRYWNREKLNIKLEPGKFYKYKDKVIQIEAIDNNAGVFYINKDSSLLNNYNSFWFFKNSFFYNKLVPATYDDILYCLRKRAEEKGLTKGKKIKYIDSNNPFLRRSFIYGNVSNFYLDFYGDANKELILCDASFSYNNILWKRSKGWIVEPVQESYIITVEGNLKYAGEYAFRVNYDKKEIESIKLVEDGIGGDKVNNYELFSYWDNAIQELIKYF